MATKLVVDRYFWLDKPNRWCDWDFEGPARNVFAVDWPIRYNDIAPWYSYVKKFVGLSGNKDGLANLPDGEFLKPHEMNCLVNHFKQKNDNNFNGKRKVIIGKVANIKKIEKKRLQGCENHEMGGIRMGKDPKTSILNKWNQLHEVKNVFVTDGASMTSTATQNPSLTYMAMTARAVEYAVREMKALRI